MLYLGRDITRDKDLATKEYVDGQIGGFYTKNQVDNLLGGKQATLVSGTNIKTINNTSILGSGNITIQGGGSTSWSDITDKPLTFPPSSHNHDDRYFTESEIDTKLSGYLPLSGGTLTGNLTGQYITGTWLQATASNHLSSAASKIAVLDSSGWVYHRTPSEVLSDIGAAASSHTHNYLPLSGGTLTGRVTSNYASSGAFLVEHGTPDTEAGFRARRTDGTGDVFVGVGSGGINHGVYSPSLGNWLIESNGSATSINGNTVTINGTTYVTDTLVVGNNLGIFSKTTGGESIALANLSSSNNAVFGYGGYDAGNYATNIYGNGLNLYWKSGTIGGHVGTTLWSGSATKGSKITVSNHTKYYLYRINTSGQGTSILAIRNGNYIRGVGGYVNDTPTNFTYHVNLTLSSGSSFTITGCDYIYHNASGSHSAVTALTITSVVGLI